MDKKSLKDMKERIRDRINEEFRRDKERDYRHVEMYKELQDLQLAVKVRERIIERRQRELKRTQAEAEVMRVKLAFGRKTFIYDEEITAIEREKEKAAKEMFGNENPKRYREMYEDYLIEQAADKLTLSEAAQITAKNAIEKRHEASNERRIKAIEEYKKMHQETGISKNEFAEKYHEKYFVSKNVMRKKWLQGFEYKTDSNKNTPNNFFSSGIKIDLLNELDKLDIEDLPDI